MNDLADAKERLYICMSKLMANPMELEWNEINECQTFLEGISSYNEELNRIASETASIASNIVNAARKGDLESHYISLFELSPECPPYLSHYAFEDEQKRRLFMVEIAEYYKKFGLRIKPGELPDYIPAIVEFLGLTAHAGSGARKVFIRKYVKPYINFLINCLRKRSILYYELYSVFNRLLDFEMGLKFS